MIIKNYSFKKKYFNLLISYFLKTIFIKKFKIISLFLTLLILILILIRNNSLFPSVMGDEFIHILNSKSSEFNNIKIYSPLYYFLYKSTFICEDQFINCARYLNLLFFLSATFIFFLLCKKFSNKQISYYIFLILLLSPFNIYSAYFMPEMSYFFFVSLLFYNLLSLDLSKKNIFVLGVLCGLCSLVKPHAIFLLPGLIAYFFFLQKANLLNISILSIGFLILKIFLYIFFSIKFSFFGEYYSSDGFNYLNISLDQYIKIIKYMIINLFGIINFLLIVFAIPLILTFNNIYVYFKIKNTTFKLAFFTFITIFSLIFIFSFFVSISANFHEHIHLHESPFRLNNRYYYFVLPLLLVVLAHNLFDFKKIVFNQNVTICLSVIFSISIIIYSFNTYENFHLVDAPLYRGIIHNNFFYVFIILFVLIMIIFFNYKKLATIKIYTFLFLPILFIISSIPINKEILFYKNPSKSNLIGMELDNYFRNEDKKKYLIINFNEKYSEKLDEFKILTSFNKQYVGIISFENQNLDNINLSNNLIKVLSKKNPYWSYSNNIDYDYIIIVLNKIKFEIYYFDTKIEILKKINS